MFSSLMMVVVAAAAAAETHRSITYYEVQYVHSVRSIGEQLLDRRAWSKQHCEIH
jgi:hypothetical protein